MLFRSHVVSHDSTLSIRLDSNGLGGRIKKTSNITSYGSQDVTIKKGTKFSVNGFAGGSRSIRIKFLKGAEFECNGFTTVMKNVDSLLLSIPQAEISNVDFEFSVLKDIPKIYFNKPEELWLKSSNWSRSDKDRAYASVVTQKKYVDFCGVDDLKNYTSLYVDGSRCYQIRVDFTLNDEIEDTLSQKGVYRTFDSSRWGANYKLKKSLGKRRAIENLKFSVYFSDAPGNRNETLSDDFKLLGTAKTYTGAIKKCNDHNYLNGNPELLREKKLERVLGLIED